MNDRTIVQHPNGYSGVLMGKSTMMIYDKDDNCIVHTCFRTPNTEKELYEVLETMPRFIEILASVEADRKTEPQTCSYSDCDNFKNPDYTKCIECKRKQIEAKRKTEPQIEHGFSAKAMCSTKLFEDESQRDEFELFDREALILLIECQRERIAELLAKTEPQTEEPPMDEYYKDHGEFYDCDRYVITNDEGERAYGCIGCQTDCSWK